MRSLVAFLAVAACGDNAIPRGEFAIVGHSDLGRYGMYSAMAIADDTAYVGSRNDRKGVLIVDIANPAAPEVVGELGIPHEGVVGMSSRELRVVPELDLLVVLNLRCSVDLHGCAMAGGEVENLKFFDITDRRAPRIIAAHTVVGTLNQPRGPHEFFLWRDPIDRARVLVLLAAPGKRSFEIIRVTEKQPTTLLLWDPYDQGGLPTGVPESLLHSVSASDDGRTGYMSHQTGGLFVVDLTTIIDQAEIPMVTMVTPAAQALKFGVMGPHSAVPVPDRPLLVVTEEVYPPPFGAGCPWGHLRVVDVTDPALPVLAGELKIPENDCAFNAPMTAYTSHNVTTTSNLALVSWYAGGLRAIDISDPTTPTQLAELMPEPVGVVAAEDPGLGGSKIHMWSYPIIKDGLIYVIDSRNGLYVLRYSGRWGEQVSERRFLEGNSNLGAYLGRH